MGIKEFIYELRTWGFRVAIYNWFFLLAARLLNAKKMTVVQREKK